MYDPKVARAIEATLKRFEDLVLDNDILDDDRDLVESIFVMFSYYQMLEKLVPTGASIRVIEIIRDADGNVQRLEVNDGSQTPEGS